MPRPGCLCPPGCWIYLVTQSKNGISSRNLARTIGVSAKAALQLKHQLQQIMKNRDDQLVLRGLLLIDDAYWGGKRRDGRMVFQWLNTVLGNVKNTLHGTCHALSNRHLPRYLAEFCCRFNHRFQLDKMVDRLLQAALHTLAAPQRLLRRAEVRWESDLKMN